MDREWRQEVWALRPSDVVNIPAGVRHRHGAVRINIRVGRRSFACDEEIIGWLFGAHGIETSS